MRPHTTLLAAVLLSASAFAASPGDEEPKVEITGGADTSGQNYLWTLTNHYTSPIVSIRLPHYHADTFHAPAGWTKQCTNLSSRKPGTCAATAESPQAGIAAGRSAEFGMRLANLSGHRRGRGEVTVRFADETEVTVANVELPTSTSAPEQLVALIGFALVFGILILVQVRRRHKARTAAPPPSSTPPADE